VLGQYADRVVHPFEIVAHRVRRRIVEVLATGDHGAGTLSEIAFTELGVTRTAVSHQLRTLREHGVVWSTVDSVESRSRSYRLDPAFVASLDLAVSELFELWKQRYGTAEGRAPSFPASSEEPRTHRFGEAERRRRRSALAEWVGGVDADADADPDVEARADAEL
jgi:DNA-binding transcriptional ArsR family regulator